jgi:hypothetical protein
MTMRHVLEESRRLVMPARADGVSAPRRHVGVPAIVLEAALGAVAAFVIFTWLLFGLDWEAVQELTVVGGLIFIFCTLFGALALRASHDPRWGERDVDFETFIDSEVDTATGPVSGREAWWTILLLPLALAFAMLSIGLVLFFTVHR